MTNLLYKEESYRIIGSCMKVHAELGPGFLESVYHEALEKQFKKDNIPYEREKLLHIYFDGDKLKKYNDYPPCVLIYISVRCTFGFIGLIISTKIIGTLSLCV